MISNSADCNLTALYIHQLSFDQILKHKLNIHFWTFIIHFLAVCDMSLCREASISCASGTALVKRPVPGSCCPDIHCGNILRHTEYIWIIYIYIHTNALMWFVDNTFVSFSLRVSVWQYHTTTVYCGKFLFTVCCVYLPVPYFVGFQWVVTLYSKTQTLHRLT